MFLDLKVLSLSLEAKILFLKYVLNHSVDIIFVFGGGVGHRVKGTSLSVRFVDLC